MWLLLLFLFFFFFFQAEDGIRGLVRSRGLGSVYKRQVMALCSCGLLSARTSLHEASSCFLYTFDAADDLPCVDPGGRRTIKKKNT